jgi:excisionase family DNA binding protein
MTDPLSADDPTTDRLLSTEQLADLLAVPLRTVYDWRYRGVGPRGIRLSGRHVRFRLSDVHAWLEAHADDHNRASA